MLGRAHQPHDLHLAAPGVQDERGGRGDRQDGGQRQHGPDPEAEDPEQTLAMGEALDPVHAAADLVRFRQGREPGDQRAGALEGRALGGRRDLQRRRQRVLRQRIGHRGILAEHLSERAEGLGLADVAHRGHARHAADAIGQQRGLSRRRLALEVDDDLHALAELGDGLAEVGREQPERAERGEGQRDQHDGTDRHPTGPAQVPQRLPEQEAEHGPLSPRPSRAARTKA